MSWIYHGINFDDDRIPDGAVGFVYEMRAIIDGKSIAYIGKKNFYSDVKRSLAKKEKSEDKRKKTYKRVRTYTYKNYYSSNDVLKAAHKSGILIHREILEICFSKTQLTYQEVKHQFVREVLESDLYLNGNILGRFYKQK